VTYYTISSSYATAIRNPFANPHTGIDRDIATAWSRWTYITPAADGKPVISQAGRYDDVLVRENDHWKFKRPVASNDIPRPK
jgi:hypothetical protein